MNKRASGIALISFAAVLWGTWPLYTRAGGPTGVAIGFLALAAMALPAPFFFRRKDFADRGAVLALVLVSIADAVNVYLYFAALDRGPVVVAVLSHYLAPTLVALGAPSLLGEGGSPRALVASPVVLLGLGLVLNQGSSVDGWGTTATLGGGSALFYAVVVLGSRRAARTFHPVAVMSLHAALSALLLLVFFGAQALPRELDRGLLIVLFGCLVNGLGAAVLFNLSLTRIEAPLVSLFTYLEPLTAAVVGVTMLGDPFGAAGALGVAMVLAAGAWAAIEPREALRTASER